MNKEKELSNFAKTLDDLEGLGVEEVSWAIFDRNRTPESQLMGVTALHQLFPSLQIIAFLKDTDNTALKEALTSLLNKIEERHTLAAARKKADEMGIILGS
jgi:hypothetical protein